MIYKLFFENISGLLRIFTNKNVNFKLIIIPLKYENQKKNNNKITYNFITTVLNFPNNIKQIFTEYSFLKKNLDYTFFIDTSLKFTLQILDGQINVSESIIINYNDIVNLESNNEKYNSNKKKIINNDDDDDINELLEYYIKKNDDANDIDDFIFEIE